MASKSELVQEINSLKLQLDKVQAEYMAQLAGNEGLRAENLALKAQNAALRAENDRLLTANEALRDENEALDEASTTTVFLSPPPINVIFLAEVQAA